MATAKILVNLYDGTRQLLSTGTRVLLTVTDGNKQTAFRDYVTVPTIALTVPFFDNFGDQYTVLASPDGMIDTGFVPVAVSPRIVRPVFLMSLPQHSEFAFTSWQDLQPQTRFVELLSQGVDKPSDQYEALMEDKPESLACLFNILTACRDLHVGQANSALDYFRQLVWNNPNFPMKQDRFYVWADPTLLTLVRQGKDQGSFVEEPDPGLLHPGATHSYKQIDFGEANVQLTFHEKDEPPKGTNWVLVEPDIDYFRDMAAHILLEVVPGFFSLTDPKAVYVLRWIAGRQANLPEFNPPYTIRQAAG